MEKKSCDCNIVLIGAIVLDNIINIDEIGMEPNGWNIASDYQYDLGGICSTLITLQNPKYNLTASQMMINFKALVRLYSK